MSQRIAVVFLAVGVMLALAPMASATPVNILYGVQTDQLTPRTITAYDADSSDGSTAKIGDIVADSVDRGGLVIIDQKLYVATFEPRNQSLPGYDRQIYQMNLDGSGYSELANIGAQVHGFATLGDLGKGPDGSLYCAVGNNEAGIYRVDKDTGAMTLFVSTGVAKTTTLAFGPDGNLYVGVDGNVDKYDGTSGALLQASFATGVANDEIRDLVFAAGKLFADGPIFSGIFSVDAATGGAFTKIHDNVSGGAHNGYMGIGPDGLLWIGRPFGSDYARLNLDGSDGSDFLSGAGIHPLGGFDFYTVPEPATVILIGVGGLGLLLRRRHRL